MVQVTWAPEALEQLRDIQAFIKASDMQAARRIAQRLWDAGESLSTFPNRGRPIAGGRRELPNVAPYVIQYRATETSVLILRIKHGRQRR